MQRGGREAEAERKTQTERETEKARQDKRKKTKPIIKGRVEREKGKGERRI